jgi:sugar phosphate isomerase/epimerase
LGDALERLLPLAEMLDVQLALEPMHPAAAADWTFITSMDAMMATLRRIESRHLGFVLDLYHFGQCEASLELAAENVDRIAVVHVADSRAMPRDDQDRCLLGRGQIPLAGAIDRLERAGYHGFYDVELVGPEIVPDVYERVVRGSLETIAQIRPELV